MSSIKHALIVPILTLSATSANAVTAEANMAVSATVSRVCTVSAGPLGFGTLSTEEENTASSVIDVTCGSANPGETTVDIRPDAGLNAAGAQRRMARDGGGGFVPYALYPTSVGGTEIAPGEALAATTSNQGRTYSATIHGRIAPSASYTVGDYADTVVILVTYSDAFVAPVVVQVP